MLRRHSLLPLILVLVFAAPVTAEAQQRAETKAPQFADYPVPVIGKVRARTPVFPRGLSEEERLRLTDAWSAEDPVNAAGRYVLVTYGCGSTCVSAGFIDAVTGAVNPLPFSVSGWREVPEDFIPIETRADSRLVIINGARNETGVVGRHYYLLDRGKLRHLRTVDTKGDFLRKAD